LCVCSLRSQALTVCGIRGREKAWNISRWGIFGIAMTNGVLMEPEFPSPWPVVRHLCSTTCLIYLQFRYSPATVSGTIPRIQSSFHFELPPW